MAISGGFASGFAGRSTSDGDLGISLTAAVAGVAEGGIGGRFTGETLRRGKICVLLVRGGDSGVAAGAGEAGGGVVFCRGVAFVAAVGSGVPVGWGVGVCFGFGVVFGVLCGVGVAPADFFARGVGDGVSLGRGVRLSEGVVARMGVGPGGGVAAGPFESAVVLAAAVTGSKSSGFGVALAGAFGAFDAPFVAEIGVGEGVARPARKLFFFASSLVPSEVCARRLPTKSGALQTAAKAAANQKRIRRGDLTAGMNTVCLAGACGPEPRE